MNYFDLYNIPLSFSPDLMEIRTKFYALSRAHHPDHHATGTEEKQTEALERSTENNKAYKILSNPQLRLQYILQLHDLLPEGENYVLPQSFLMEMMDVNEGLMELEFEKNPAELEKLSGLVAGIEKALQHEFQELIKGFESLTEAGKKERLLQVKDIYFRNKYLARIKESLGILDQ